MRVCFFKVNCIKSIVILEHLARIRLRELPHICIKALIIKILNDVVDSFQFFPHLCAVLSLQIYLFDKLAKESFPKFSNSVEEIWRFHVVEVEEFHLSLDGGDSFVNFLIFGFHARINYKNIWNPILIIHKQVEEL